MSFPIRNRNDAKNTFENSANYLTRTIYEGKPIKKIQTEKQIIETLAFLYHFHRYNLSKILLNEMVDRKLNTVLRTNFVHCLSSIDFDPTMMIATQQMMKACIDRDKFCLLSNKKGEAEKPELIFEKTPLFELFNFPHKRVAQSMHFYHSVQDKDLSNWLVNQIAPYFNALNVARIQGSQEAKSAMYLMIMVLGEYCTTRHCRAMHKSTQQRNIAHVMHQAKILRNALAHDVVQISDKQLNTFARDIHKLNKKIGHPSELKDLLVISKVANKSTLFAHRSATQAKASAECVPMDICEETDNTVSMTL